jgi:hypothetical protein
VDRVSVLPGLMCSTTCVAEPQKSACVAGAVDDGVSRCQACVAGVDGTQRVVEELDVCVTEELGVCHRARR